MFLQQLFVDAEVPEGGRELLAAAISGDEAALELLRTEYWDELGWLLTRIESDAGKTLFNIGIEYYNGYHDVSFQNRAKAFEWAVLSARRGYANAALCAGDMAKYGDGVTVDEQAAYEFYALAHSIKPDVYTNERLGYCYFNGIGVAADRQKAFDFLLKCAVDGNAAGLYGISGFGDELELDLDALYKAAGRQIYTGLYNENSTMKYDGDDYIAANNVKRDVTKKISEMWESESHPVVRPDEYFSLKFIEELTETTYTYSFEDFAHKYQIHANRTHEDAHRFHFQVTDEESEWYIEQYVTSRIEQEYYSFYEYDFDGCGVDEIAVSTASGAGGATMRDGYAVFKENNDGMYEYFADGPDCALRDDMHIIKYDDRIYFIYNPYDETYNEPDGIVAYTIDADGKGRALTITLTDYSPRHVFTYTNEIYSAGYDDLLLNINNQTPAALQDARYQRIYSPEGEARLDFQHGDDIWGDTDTDMQLEYEQSQDVFFVADIDNDGTDNVVHKGRSLAYWKSYSYFSWFEVYENLMGFNDRTANLRKPEFNEIIYGLESAGNLHDILPIGNSVSQFLTYEHDGVTYCVTIERYGLIYARKIFHVKNGEPNIVSQSLFFDDAQTMEVKFSYK